MEIDNKILAAITSLVVAIISVFKVDFTLGSKNSNNDIAKLVNHPVHQRIINFQSYIKHGIEAELKGKELLVKDFLLNTFQFYGETLKEIAIEVDNKDLTPEEVRVLNERYFNSAMDDMITYFYISDYNDDEIQALKILSEKFQRFYYKKSENFLQDICDISDSNYYKNPDIIQAIIFDKYIGLLASVLTWFDEVIDILNGEFEGLEFQGEVITDENNC